MTWTARDIETEHREALASLTPAQRRALDRLQKARRQAAFNHHRPEENLQALFEAEAERLNAEAPRVETRLAA